MPKGFSLSSLKRFSPPRPVALVPTGFCFIHRENKPEDVLKAADVRAFAALCLEGMSPFPQEQLAWGVLDAPKQPFVWLVAALKERLAREAVPLSENAAYALPAFVVVCPIGLPKARQLFLWEENTLTCLRFGAGALWPSALLTEPLDNPTAEAAFAKREQLLHDARLGLWEGETFDGIYAEPTAVAAPSGALEGTALHIESPQSAGVRVPILWPRQAQGLLWDADLRDAAFLAREGARRKRANLLWYIGLGAVAACLLLLFWQLGLRIAESRLSARTARIAAQKPLVDAVHENQQLLMKIERASGNELQPFVMLGLFNRTRTANETTKSVYLVNAQAENLTQMTVQGKASSIAQVNTLVENLKKSGAFKAVNLADVKAKYTGADFTLKLDFKPLPAPKAVAEAPVLEAAQK